MLPSNFTLGELGECVGVHWSGQTAPCLQKLRPADAAAAGVELGEQDGDAGDVHWRGGFNPCWRGSVPVPTAAQNPSPSNLSGKVECLSFSQGTRRWQRVQAQRDHAQPAPGGP